MAEDWVEVPFRVLKEHHGMRVDAFLSSRLRKYSRVRVQKLIEDGQVVGRAKASSRVADGETVLVRYPRTAEPAPVAETLPLLYKDDALAVIDKPGGMLSHPTDKIHRNTVTYLLGRQLGVQTVHLAHRLDRETSGVVMLAKHRAANRLLAGMFERGEVEKRYLAIVY